MLLRPPQYYNLYLILKLYFSKLPQFPMECLAVQMRAGWGDLEELGMSLERNGSWKEFFCATVEWYKLWGWHSYSLRVCNFRHNKRRNQTEACTCLTLDTCMYSGREGHIIWFAAPWKESELFPVHSNAYHSDTSAPLFTVKWNINTVLKAPWYYNLC